MAEKIQAEIVRLSTSLPRAGARAPRRATVRNSVTNDAPISVDLDLRPPYHVRRLQDSLR